MDQDKLIHELLKGILAELPKMLAPKALYTIDEAAHYLGLAPKTIRNGLGPRAEKPFPIKPVRVGGRVVFKKEDLDSFVDGLKG